jgi:hypothetical protein
MKDLSRLSDAALPLQRAADGLPGDVLNDAAMHLRRPFTPEAVKWKLQSSWAAGSSNAGGIVIPYIDARLVVERLNAVVPGLWTADFKTWGQKATMCELTIDGITRRDVGTGGVTEPEKAIISDALKRAAVHFGVGVSIYGMKQVSLYVYSGPDEARLKQREKTQRDGKKKWVVELPDPVKKWLGEKYAEWLEARGERMYGPVLDHGDEAGAFGADDELEGGVEEPGEVSLPALETPEAAQLIEEVADAYAMLREADPMVLLPAAYQAKLAAAHHSVEELAALRAEIEALANAALDKAAAGEES